MGTPAGNGLVEIFGEKTQERGFFCMKLVGYLNEEAKMGTPEYAELWDIRFADAKAGRCAYRDKCPIYARTKEKHGNRPVQLCLNFE